jgi:hypothetical protein
VQALATAETAPWPNSARFDCFKFWGNEKAMSYALHRVDARLAAQTARHGGGDRDTVVVRIVDVATRLTASGIGAQPRQPSVTSPFAVPIGLRVRRPCARLENSTRMSNVAAWGPSQSPEGATGRRMNSVVML